MKTLVLVMLVAGLVRSRASSALAVVPDGPEVPDAAETEREAQAHISARSDSSGPIPLFEPTCEWKEVLDGQHIPAGLEIRMNLDVGGKQAKLLDRHCRHGKPIHAAPEAAPTDAKIDGAGVIPLDRPDRLLPEGQTLRVPKRNPSIDAKFHKERMDAHLKKMAESLFHQENPVAIMQQHIRTIVTAESTMEDIRQSLVELEDLVTDIDNANDLHTIGGLAPVIGIISNASEADRHFPADVVAQAMWVLGSAQQSNPKVQHQAISLGGLPAVLQYAHPSAGSDLLAKTLYALSTLIRDNNPAREGFVELGGVASVVAVVKNATSPFPFCDRKVATKAVALFSDLLAEESSGNSTGLSAEYEASGGLAEALASAKWCEVFLELAEQSATNPAVFNGQAASDDTIEKILKAAAVLPAQCSAARRVRFPAVVRTFQARWIGKPDDEYAQELLTLSKSVQSAIESGKDVASAAAPAS